MSLIDSKCNKFDPMRYYDQLFFIAKEQNIFVNIYCFAMNFNLTLGNKMMLLIVSVVIFAKYFERNRPLTIILYENAEISVSCGDIR